MAMIINGERTDAELFAYDGCHKIYIIESDDDENKMRELGYRAILPIEWLPDAWKMSCSLRFISNASLTKNFVHQFEEATFETVS